MKEKLWEIIFTNTCHVCGETIGINKDNLCKECKKEIEYVGHKGCKKCGRPLYGSESLVCNQCTRNLFHFDEGVCLFAHTGKVCDSIYQFKYGNRREYAKFYGMEVNRIYGSLIKEWGIELIVPVPIHKMRELKRGYNQASVFAKQVSKYTGIPVNENIIVRQANTVPQKELSENMRKQNLENAFMIDEMKAMSYKRVLLVDDILTTGSTLDACSRILKKAGVGKVYFVCISGGVN